MAEADRSLAAFERELADEAVLQLLVGELRSVDLAADPDPEAWLRRWPSPDA